MRGATGRREAGVEESKRTSSSAQPAAFQGCRPRAGAASTGPCCPVGPPPPLRPPLRPPQATSGTVAAHPGHWLSTRRHWAAPACSSSPHLPQLLAGCPPPPEPVCGAHLPPSSTHRGRRRLLRSESPRVSCRPRTLRVSCGHLPASLPSPWALGEQGPVYKETSGEAGLPSRPSDKGYDRLQQPLLLQLGTGRPHPTQPPCSRSAPAGLVPARGWALLPPAAAGVGPGTGGQQVRARGRHPAPHLSSAGRLAARVSPRWEGTRSLGPRKVRGRDRAEQPPPETSSNPGPARLAEPGLLPRRGNALCSAVPAKGGPGSF